MGGPTSVGLSHIWYGLDREKDFESHLEWFAEVDGGATASHATAAGDSKYIEHFGADWYTLGEIGEFFPA